MITWLQQNVFKHQRVLFGFLLFIIVIAFVLMSGSGSGSIFHQENSARKALFFGVEVNSLPNGQLVIANSRLRMDLQRRAEISQRLNFRRAGDLERAVMLSLCDRLGVPEPTPEQLKKYAAEVPGLMDFGQKSEKSRIAELIDFCKNRLSLSEEAAKVAIETALVEDWRVARLEQIIGSSSVLLPAEAVARARDEKTVRSADVAELSFADYSAKNPVADPAPDVLEAFYKTRAEAYAVPAKPRHTAVVFEGSTLVAGLPAALDEAEIKKYFESHKSRYEIKVEPPKVAVEPTLENSREKVVYDLTQEKLKELREKAAGDAANLFLDKMDEAKLKGTTSPGFKEAVEKLKGRIISLPALSPEDSAVPAPLIAADFNNAARLVTELEPTPTKPFKINGGYGFLFFEATEPGRQSKLEEVKGKVIAEWKENEARTAWDKALSSGREQLVKAVAAGTSFKEAAEKLGFKVTPVEDFTPAKVPTPTPTLRDVLVSNNTDGNPQVSPLISKLKKGDLSANSGGKIVFLRKLEIPTLTPESPEVAAVMASGSEELSRNGYHTTLSELLSLEQKRVSPPAEPAPKKKN